MAEQNIDKTAFAAAVSAGKKGKTHRGTPHSDETKKVLSEKAHLRMSDPARNPFIGKKRSNESREKQSETRSARMAEGAYNSWFARGYIQTTKGHGRIHYKSSWEKRLVEKLEADPRVLTYWYEPFAIVYDYEGHKRRYHPDFLVVYQDLRRVMYEVKPNYFLDAKINVAKFKAARKYCEEHGTEFRILTEKEGDLS